MTKKIQYIKMKDLKDGFTYRINARNASWGVWREKNNDFVISRFKFRDNYTFEEIHFDASDDFGTVKPLERIEKCQYNIYDYKEKEMLDYLNSFDNIRCSECGCHKKDWVTHEDWCSEKKKI